MEKLLNEAQKQRRPLAQGFAADLLEHSVLDNSAKEESAGWGFSFLRPTYVVTPHRDSTGCDAMTSDKNQPINESLMQMENLMPRVNDTLTTVTAYDRALTKDFPKLHGQKESEDIKMLSDLISKCRCQVGAV